MKRSLGFSFIEIMVILILLGIVATIAVPQFFSAFENTRVSELRYLTRIINLLRNEAILGHNKYFVVFDFEEQKYHVEVQRKEGGQSIVETPKMLRAHSFPSDFRLEDVFFGTKLSEIRFRSSILKLAKRKPISIAIDSSGFVTPFILVFAKGKETWLIQTKNIMGHLTLEQGEDAIF